MVRTCVFVSGFGAPGFEWFLSPLPGLLRCYDWDVKVFRSGVGCPEERAEQIASAISRVRGPVSAVGHSMGGVVCEALDVATGRLDHVVTLGSPLGGVPLLHMVPSWLTFKGLNQLRERSECLARIRAGSHNAEYLCVAGTRDPVVSRQSAWAIRNARTVVVPSGHTELFARKDVARMVVDFFGVKSLARLRAA